jgi:hypothetical protein
MRRYKLVTGRTLRARTLPTRKTETQDRLQSPQRANGGEACFVGTLSNLGATPSVSRWIGTQPSDGAAGVRRSAFICCF